VVKELVSVEISVVDSSVETDVDSVEDVVGSKDVEMEVVKSEVVLNGDVSVVSASEDSVLESV
jgi:hypothetical protein